MATEDEIDMFLSDYELGQESWLEGQPRVWFQHLEDDVAVFCLAEGESPDDPALQAMADAAIAALKAKHPDCSVDSARLEAV